jgi:integrase
MNLYRPKFKDRKTGELRECPRWYVDLRDHYGTRQRFAGSEDKHETAEFGRMLEDLVRCRKRAVQPKDRLWNWLMGLPADVQGKLVDLDLADRAWFAVLTQSERLSVWVDEYESWLRTSKTRTGFHRNRDHVQTVMHRLRAIVAGCGFKTWADIRKSAVESYLGGLSVSLRTLNGYLVAVKGFCTWAVDDERADYSPLQRLKPVTVPDKERRRPLGFDEVCKLLKKTVSGPRHHAMDGEERAVLYLLAIQTGFRRNELAHLTVASFDLSKATVSLPAEFCKDRRDAIQVITMALASRLAGFLAGKGPEERVFRLNDEHTAEMLQEDAAEAGLPMADEQGRELVFHSLRHTLRTELERARVSDGVIDSLMRHKPGGVGKKFYRHVHDFERREAIERLPEYPWPADLVESQRQAKKAVS